MVFFYKEPACGLKVHLKYFIVVFLRFCDETTAERESLHQEVVRNAHLRVSDEISFFGSGWSAAHKNINCYFLKTDLNLKLARVHC